MQKVVLQDHIIIFMDPESELLSSCTANFKSCGETKQACTSLCLSPVHNLIHYLAYLCFRNMSYPVIPH